MVKTVLHAIFTEKKKENGSKMLKARLVEQGSAEEKTMNERTGSPTCGCQAFRKVFVSASIMSWELHSLDITSAFLKVTILKEKLLSDLH